MMLDAIFNLRPRSSIIAPCRFAVLEYVVEKDLVTDSPEFQKIKDHLKKAQKDLEADKKKRPMLRRMPECDESKANPV
jgi:hypothetical protein